MDVTLFLTDSASTYNIIEWRCSLTLRLMITRESSLWLSLHAPCSDQFAIDKQFLGKGVP